MQTEPYHPNGDAGGQGEETTCLRLDDHHRREHLRMIAQGLARGWLRPIDLQGLLELLPATLRALIHDDSARVRMRAVELAIRAAAHNLALAEAVDHANRLDGGEATERADAVLRIEFDERPVRALPDDH